MNSNSRVLFALLLCASVLGQACNGNVKTLDPNEAYGPAGTTPPPEAKIISQDEFLNLFSQDQLVLTNDKTKLQDLGNMASVGATATVKLAPTAHNFVGRDGKQRKVHLMKVSDLAAHISLAQQTYSDPENQVRVAALRNIPTPTPAPIPVNTPSLVTVSCSGSEGNGVGSDITGVGSTCDRHSINGIYANYNWPLKGHISCTKDQANRGTCGAFAIVATLETEVSVRFGRKVNLSEQDLYSHVKNNWWPTFYGDGVGPDGVYNKMSSAGYVVPFEKLWDYNPSNSRTDDSDKDEYVHSCDNYAESCSDTAHQAQLYCTTYQNSLYCGFSSPVNAVGTGFKVDGSTEIWDSSNGDNAIANIVAALGNNHGITLGINVPPSWDNASADGYITYVAQDGASRGGHLVEVVGSITNDQLSKILPTAPAGSGGGYLIIKNSWGPCYADGGLVYAPYDWVKQNAWSATIIEDVTAM